MHFTNEFVSGLEKRIHIPQADYAMIQSRNVCKMLKNDKRWYTEFGVYWWAVKDAIGLVQEPYWFSHKSRKMRGILQFLSGSCSKTEVFEQLY